MQDEKNKKNHMKVSNPILWESMIASILEENITKMAADFFY